MPAYVEDKLTRILRSDPRYTVIPTRPTEALGRMDKQLDGIDAVSMSDEIKPEVADFLKSLADKHHVDVIIVIKSFDLSGDLKNLPQSEIDKLEPIIQKYADQAIANALDDANLIFY